MKTLNPKQKQFCQEYLLDGNAAGAARRAGYKPKAAKEGGYELLTKPHIQAYLKVIRAAAAEKHAVKLEDVVARIDAIGKDEEHKDQLKANDLLMRHLGGFEKDNTQKSENITFRMNLSK